MLLFSSDWLTLLSAGKASVNSWTSERCWNEPGLKNNDPLTSDRFVNHEAFCHEDDEDVCLKDYQPKTDENITETESISEDLIAFHANGSNRLRVHIYTTEIVRRGFLSDQTLRSWVISEDKLRMLVVYLQTVTLRYSLQFLTIPFLFLTIGGFLDHTFYCLYILIRNVIWTPIFLYCFEAILILLVPEHGLHRPPSHFYQQKKNEHNRMMKNV